MNTVCYFKDLHFLFFFFDGDAHDMQPTCVCSLWRVTSSLPWCCDIPSDISTGSHFSFYY